MSQVGTYLQENDWPFGSKLTTNHVWDAFIIWALLNNHQHNNTTLQVPHIGDKKDHFKAGMEERNKRIIFYGQPDAVRHVCNKCCRIFEIDGRYCE